MLCSACETSKTPSPPPSRAGCRAVTCPPAFLPRSKAAILILLWNMAMNFTLGSISILALSVPFKTLPTKRFLLIFVMVYGAIGLVQLLFYPLGGLVADLRCGRFKTVLCGTVSLWLAYFCLCLIVTFYISAHHNSKERIVFYCVVGVLTALLAVSGLTSFQANVVQFGLDQLQDQPSCDLSMFLHWLTWMEFVGVFLGRMAAVTFTCDQIFAKVAPYFPYFIFVVLSVMLFLSCCGRNWFHSEPHSQNPYSTVVRVLRFMAVHDRPLRRSALTFCEDERPTRFDFAKQRFGGPFSTGTVEDVKTFLRILVMLLAVGPVFSLFVATYYIFPLFGLHVGGGDPISQKGGCGVTWLLLQSNNLSHLFVIVLLPLYVIFVYPRYVPRWFSGILRRLGTGVALLALSVVSMLGIESAGHLHARVGDHNTTCMFQAEYRSFGNFTPSQNLNFYASLLLVPNVLTGLGAPLVFIAIPEFISAQSPHAMKGLLLGVYYAIRGLFVILGCLLTAPFLRRGIWKECGNEVTNCGFYYYLMNTVLGLGAVLLFWAAARWYQYRVREDRPYGHHYVEEYYSRYAGEGEDGAAPNGEREEEEEEVLVSHVQDYGTA